MRSLPWLLLPFFLFLGGWSALRSARNQTPLHALIFGVHRPVPLNIALLGSIDTVTKPGLIRSSGRQWMMLQGWAAFTSGAKISYLELSVDGRVIRRIKGLTTRPDVADFYRRPDFELSGWSTHLPLARFASGRHQLLITAVANNGQTASLPSVMLVID